jgi:hypothetical protein
MILKEGDKVRKTENGIVYEVKKIHEKGFVILSSDDGSHTALMSMNGLDLYFRLVKAPPGKREVPCEERIPKFLNEHASIFSLSFATFLLFTKILLA